MLIFTAEGYKCVLYKSEQAEVFITSENIEQSQAPHFLALSD